MTPDPQPRPAVELEAEQEVDFGSYGRKIAARWWLLATLLAVYWANLHMALRPEKFPRFKPALLYARLPVQGLFAWLTWRGTRPA